VPNRSKFNYSHAGLALLPSVALLVIWEIAGRESKLVQFFFSFPTQISVAFFEGVGSGELLIDFLYTLLPTVIGFIIGVSAGTLLGFLLLFSGRATKIAEWNVLILGSVPIFAIAPMMLVWFGIGIAMKVAMAVLSTIFVALSHAYRGGRSVPLELQLLFRTNQADDTAAFRKLVLPMSLDWVFASLRLNANLALLGVFVGEYMASERGLGHAMLKAGSLYRVAHVLATALAMILLVVIIDRSVALIERHRHKLIQWFAVDHRLMRMTPPHGA
jgi:NitT/TauT family transport system permease protein